MLQGYNIFIIFYHVIELTILYYRMGSSQSQRERTISFPNADQRIGQPSFCPKCGAQFPPNITYNILELHIQLCLNNTNFNVPPPFQQTIQQAPKKNTHQSQFIYQKIPINQQKTQFRWDKMVVIPVNLQKLKSLSLAQLKSTDFQSRQAVFRYQLQKYRVPWENGADTLTIQKGNILMSSIQNIFKIHFLGDKVNDAGGLLREWIHLALKQLFNPEIGVFELTNTQEKAYKIKWDKELDREFTESLLQLFGIIIGKAIFQRIPLNCYLDRTLMRQILGQQLTLEDISGYDKELYKSWKYLSTNTIEPFGQYFSIIKEHDDKSIEIIELIPNGKNIQVSEENKNIFIKRMMTYLCTESISQFIQSLKKGIHKVVPEKLLVIFQPWQLDMIVYGTPFIDLNDWRDNTQYKGAYYKSHQVIKWFWDFMDSLNQTQLGRFLQYCTGSTRIPIQGFSKLQTNRGNNSRFLIQSVVFNKLNPYAKAHTCFNRLELPMYPTEQMLKAYMIPLVNNDLEGVYGLD